jgi:hypothetical protein
MRAGDRVRFSKAFLRRRYKNPDVEAARWFRRQLGTVVEIETHNRQAAITVKWDEDPELSEGHTAESLAIAHDEHPHLQVIEGGKR